MKVKDKNFVEYLSPEEMHNIITRMANDVKRDYQGKNPLFLVMLNGAFIFAADFLRALDGSCEVQFVKYTSYEGMHSTGVLKPVVPIQNDIRDRDVVIVEDIVDTGTTMSKILEMMKGLGPKSVAVASLFCKPEVLQDRVTIQYLGMPLPNKFVVGFGLDYDGFGRNLPGLYILEE